jgi:uncharacterized protein (DUF1778 family)
MSARDKKAEMSQANLLVLSDSDWKQFVEITESPIKTNKNLKSAIAKFNKISFSALA